ncbi:MAG TPA: hypothetical protein VGO59_11410 [Verrucomicrobiae bacterium]|jgi:hypothetical protein
MASCSLHSRAGAACAALFVFLAGLCVVATHNYIPLVTYRPDNQFTLPYMPEIDDQSYRAMAEGKSSQVPSPFTKRAFYPWLCRVVSRCAKLSTPVTCMMLNCAAWGLLAYSLAALLEETAGLPWLSAIFLLTPVPLESLLLGYMPELFHMALLALFFLLLLRRRQQWALAILFLAFITRESTLVLCLVCAWIAWARGERRLAWGSLLALVAGTAAGAWFVRLGAPNLHHLPDSAYLVFKVGYNFLQNVLGIALWSNSMVPARSAPSITWTLPHFLQLGLVREVGLSFQWRFPVDTLVALLTVFGVAPLVFPRTWKNRRAFRELPVAIQVAFGFGAISYLLGPALGAAIFRLPTAGWPLVWIAIPHLAKHLGLEINSQDRLGLAACYLLVEWIPFVTEFWDANRMYAWLLVIPPLYLVAYRILKRSSWPDASRQTV